MLIFIWGTSNATTTPLTIKTTFITHVVALIKSNYPAPDIQRYVLSPQMACNKTTHLFLSCCIYNIHMTGSLLFQFHRETQRKCQKVWKLFLCVSHLLVWKARKQHTIIEVGQMVFFSVSVISPTNSIRHYWHQYPAASRRRPLASKTIVLVN